METLLCAVIIIFMLFLCALCLFAVLVIARDIITESSARRRRVEERKNTELKKDEEPKCETVAVNEPKVQAFELPAEEENEETEPSDKTQTGEDSDDENSVTFSKSLNMTMESRYAALSSEFKSYFDEVVRHVLSKDGVKVNKRTSYHDYKIGAKRVMRISIKRGEIVCEFTFIDRDFNTYAHANNVKLKPSATSIRVTEASAVGVAKDGIDIVCAQIAEEKEYKRELARAKRRERRRQKANASGKSEQEVIVEASEEEAVNV